MDGPHQEGTVGAIKNRLSIKKKPAGGMVRQESVFDTINNKQRQRSRKGTLSTFMTRTSSSAATEGHGSRLGVCQISTLKQDEIA